MQSGRSLLILLYPHNHDLGAEVLAGKYSKSPFLLPFSAALYTQRIEEATQKGERKVVESLLKSGFGLLDEQLSTIIEPLLSLKAEEFTFLFLQLSREELLARFGG